MRDSETPEHSPSVPDTADQSGLAELDVQHEVLFALANRLQRNIAAGAPLQVMLAELSELRNCAAAHFEAEEELMHATRLAESHQDSHRRAHRDFLRHLDRVSRLLVTNADTDIGQLFSFLQKWLELHTAGSDRLLEREIEAASTEKSAPPGQPVVLPDTHALNESIEELYALLGERSVEILELTLHLHEEIARRKKAEKDFSLSQMWIRTMADYAHSWEYWQGPDREVIYISPSCEDITGYTVAEFTENPSLLYTIIHPEDRHLMDIRMHYIAQRKEDDGELDFRIIRRDGTIRWMAHTCKAVYGKNGQSMGRRVSRRDRTERYREEESLRMAAAVFDVVNEAVLVTDRDNCIIAVNPSFTAITGYQAHEVIGKDPRILSDDNLLPELEKDLWRTLVRTGRWQGEMTNRRKNGEPYVCWLSINSVRNDAGHVTSFVSVFSDITERKADEKRIHYLAHYDLTTELPNRALFNDRLRQSVLAAKRYQARVALMFIDLDKFKPVNDRFGHDVGDLLLREVATRLRNCLRESDTAARIGGDEFVVLLPGTDSDHAIMTVAAKVLQEIEQPFFIADHNISISASIGVAVFPDHGEDVHQILKHADYAMYKAKHGRGGAIISYGDLSRPLAGGQQELPIDLSH